MIVEQGTMIFDTLENDGSGWKTVEYVGFGHERHVIVGKTSAPAYGCPHCDWSNPMGGLTDGSCEVELLNHLRKKH